MNFSNPLNKKTTQSVQFFTALVVMLCGLPTLLNLAAVKESKGIFSYWTPMHVNTSVGLLCFGAAICALILKKDKLARALGLFIFTLGLLTFSQYIFKTNFGIDEIIRKAHYNILNEHPGRMAIASSICFTISGFVLLVLSAHDKMKYSSIASGVLSAIPTGIGLITLLSYMLETVATYNTGVLSHMSLPTAWGFMFGGAFLLSLSFKLFIENRHENYSVGSVIFAATLFLGFLAVWQFLINEEQKYLHNLVNLKASSIQAELKTKINETTLAVERFASRVSYLGSKDKKYLSMDAQAYLSHIKILSRVGLVDKKYNVIWSYPNELSYQVQGFNHSTDPYRKEALERALRGESPTFSHSVELKSGGIGFILPFLLQHKNDPAQFIYVAIKANKLFENLVNLTDKNYQMSIFEDGKKIYQTENFQDAPKEFAKMTTLNLANKGRWEIVVSPNRSFLAHERSTAPYIVLFGGAVISFLVGIFLYIITLAKKREEKQNEEQRILTKQLNLALSSSHMAVWSLDLNTGKTWRSANHDKIFGHHSPLETWTRDSYMSHMAEEECEKFKASLQQAIDNNHLPHKADFTIQRCNDLSVRYISMVSQLQIDEVTKSERIIGFIRDITNERIEENKRFIDAERIKAILNSTNHSIIASDENGTILTFNAAAEKMLGYKKSEVLGKVTQNIFHDADEVKKRAKALSFELKRVIEPGFEVFVAKTKYTNQVDENEWTYIRKDGSRFPIILSVTALRDLHGKIVGFLGVAVDLTEQKKIQEQIQMTNDRLERVIEASEEGIWERDYNTKEILYIDDQSKRIFGIAKDVQPNYQEIVSRIHPDDKPLLAKVIDNHVRDNTPHFHMEFRIASESSPNKFKWVRARGNVENNNGVLGRLVSTVADITQDVETRTELEHALQAASEAALVKSAFLASMSHEIRTPLNGIIGMTDLLLETPLTEDQRRFADIVQTSGVGLLDLINDILDFSKIESGKLELENADFSLSSLVENQTDLLMARARKKNISLTTYVAPELPQTFRGDSGRIGQVLLNLIGNAVKFTQTGGVSIRVFPLYGLEKNANRQRIRFEVIDTGIGISEENTHKLFQPFSQADNKISRKFGGTGLGLSISKQLIEAMKGEIGVESSLDSGSTFWFEIPLQVTNHADFFAKYPLLKDLSNIRILLIDEDALTVNVMKQYISSWKMHEIKASTFAEAHHAIAHAIEEKTTFDIAIVYIKDESSPAFKLGLELKEHFGSLTPRLLALTEFEFKFNDEKATQQGFFDTIRKPLKQSMIFDAISRAISGEKRAKISENAAYPIHDSKSIRIMVADDVKTNRLLAVSMLEKLGYSAYAVSSGTEVLEALKQMHFDIILMDCLMPEMDGIEATKKIRELKDPYKKNVPIIALTANVNTVDRDICIDAGMNAFLGKPLLKDDMKDTIECLLASRMSTNMTDEKSRILLVDDNEENRTLILHYLKDLPYEIDIAVDGLDAFEKFKKSRYCLVLMDMQMPVMDGYEATKTIREWEIQEARNRTVICALTANAMKEECDRAFAMGCDAHLSKPIRKQKLIEYITKTIDEQKLKPLCLIAS